MEKEKSFTQNSDSRNIPVCWDLLQPKNRNDKNVGNKRRHLPLATLVRIRGPPKVIDGFSNFSVNKSDQYPHVCTQIDIGTLEPTINKKKDSKPRPILLQSRQVLGRYFPKPAYAEDCKGFWKNAPENIASKSAMKPFDVRPKKGFLGPKTSLSLRSTSTERKSVSSIEQRLRCSSEKKLKTERQVTFPEKRNNLVGFLSGTPKQIHSRHSVFIGGDNEIKNDIFSNKLVTVSAC